MKRLRVVDPPVVEDPADEPEPEPETVAVVEYPHCQTCVAILALDEEKARGVCEGCEPLPEVEGENAPVAEATVPADVPLPFPPAPCEPFDFRSAFVDITKKNRTVESLQRVYLELSERAKDAKKQWEAAASAATLAISEYDRKAREAEAAEERQAALQAAYAEQLEAENRVAAEQAMGIAETAPTADERVPIL